MNSENLESENMESAVSLTEEKLTDIAGGQDDPSAYGKWAAPCPACGTLNDPYDSEDHVVCIINHYKCSNCGFEYNISSGA